MFTQVCLGVIAVTLSMLAVILIRISFQIRPVIHFLKTDAHPLSIELKRLTIGLNQFVNSDLRVISQETSHLIAKLGDVASDIDRKSHSLDILFKPFHFLNSKLSPGSSSDGSISNRETIPQTMKWVASSVDLFKTIKEFIKHEK